uniref:Uncharacterized protein n=1 Tax=Trypanosoma vivax (strain Y486) TaxID=1055687 RepID=G0U184_TRYVY|nr:conserved hypothetical protein [Trypanosoma vivax Y486]
MAMCLSFMARAAYRAPALLHRMQKGRQGKNRSKLRASRKWKSTSGGPSRDIIGMTIPEARLHRNHLSLEAFDRCVEESARDIIGTTTDDSPSLKGVFGAFFDRRQVRYRGHADDVRRLAETSSRMEASKECIGRVGTCHPGGEFSSPGAVAYVKSAVVDNNGEYNGGHVRQQKDGRTTMDVKSRVVDLPGFDAHPLLRRVLRNRGGLPLPTDAVAKESTTVANSVPRAQVLDRSIEPDKRTVCVAASPAPSLGEGGKWATLRRRRQRKLASVQSRCGLPFHPCILQGGCAGTGDASHCAFAMQPSTVCLEWLRRGCCEGAKRCACPWWHGDEARALKAEALHHFFFATTANSGTGIGARTAAGRDETCDEGSRCSLEESRLWVGTLLQMFLDIVVSSVAASIGGCNSIAAGDLTRERIKEMLCAPRCVTTDASPQVLYDPAGGLLSVERELCVSALMADCGEGSLDSFNCRPSGCSSLYHGDVPEQRHLHEASRRLSEVLVAFRGYVAPHNDSRTGEACVCLNPCLTHWVLESAIRQLTQVEGEVAESSLLDLFEEASIILLRSRLEMCGIAVVKGTSEICPTRLNADTEKAGVAPSCHCSALLLLQHLSTLSQVPSSNSSQFAVAQGEESPSLLYVALMVTQSCGSGDQSRWPGHGLQQQYQNCWLFLQSVLSIITVRILRGGPGLFAFSRPALVEVCRDMAKHVEAQFEHRLLLSVGWTPWKDKQMFSQEHSEAYVAEDYARLHTPTTACSFTVSALHVFLLHTLRAGCCRQCLYTSPVDAVLFSEPGIETSERGSNRTSNSLCTDEKSEELISREKQLRGGVEVRRGVRPYASEAMSLLSLLHDEGAAAIVRRQEVMAEFEQRRAEFIGSTDKERQRRRGAHAGTSLTRGKPGTICHASGETVLSTGNDVHMFTKLLPHGSVMLSGDVFGLLLRILLEGGSPFKALRLAASSVHMSRMLRRAARQPMPTVKQCEKIVHKRVRNRITGRKQVVRTRVPVFRRYVPSASAGHRRCLIDAQPIALYLQLNEFALAEVTRLALRMRSAGTQLLRGVCNDCVGGLIVDYGQQSCLPAPTAADVCGDGTVAVSLGARMLQSTLLKASALCGQSSASLQTFLPLSAGHKGCTEGAVVGHPVPPTAMMMELLLTLTPSEDEEAHRCYERLCGMDPHLLFNDRVLLAKQYLDSRKNFVQVINEAAAVWHSFLDSSVAQSLELLVGTAVFSRETDRLPTLTNPCPTVPSTPSPRNVKELQEWFACIADGESDGLRNLNLRDAEKHSAPHRHRAVNVWTASQTLAMHASNPHLVQRMRWSALGGVLLALQEKHISGAQGQWAQTLLRNLFLMSQCFVRDHDRKGYTQATVRLFLLSTLLNTEARVVGSSIPSGLPAPSVIWHSMKICNLQQFIAIQLHLATKLGEADTKRRYIHKQIHAFDEKFMCFKSSLEDVMANNSASSEHMLAWSLAAPLIRYPEVGAAWLRDTFFSAPPSLIAWIAARTDTTNTNNVTSLVAWAKCLLIEGTIDEKLYSSIKQQHNKTLTCKQIVHAIMEKTKQSHKKMKTVETK